jgi:hypothetical protein
MKVLYTDSRKAMTEDAEIEGLRKQEAEKMGWPIALPGDPAQLVELRVANGSAKKLPMMTLRPIR